MEPLTFCTQVNALTTEQQRTHGELGHIQGSCMTCILRTATCRISDVKIVLSVKDKDGKFLFRIADLISSPSLKFTIFLYLSDDFFAFTT